MNTSQKLMIKVLKGENKMKVILLADIKGVGKKDEVINASDGYAINFLFPKKLAVEANNENMAKLKSKNESKAYQKEMDIKLANQLAEKINSISMKMQVKQEKMVKYLEEQQQRKFQKN